MSATEELKPCPFCGSNNITAAYHSPFVICEDCNAFGPGNADLTHDEAVELWNTRTSEQAIAATLGGGILTAHDVWEAISNHGVSRLQAIADELNAALGGGECEIETTESWLPAERYHRCKHCGAFFAVLDASGDIPPCVCPNCGKAVKR